MNQDFQGSMCVNVTCLFAFAFASLTESCLFMYGLKDLFTLQKLADKVVLDHEK